MAATNFQIEKSSLWKDIEKIINSNTGSPYSNITLVIHTEVEDYSPLVLRNLDILRDYDTSIGDCTFITFDISFGDYVQRLYPFTHNMDITITYKDIPHSSSKTTTKKKTNTQRFKAVFLPDENLHVNLSEFHSTDKNTLDRLQIVTVKMQILNRSLEPLRIKYYSSVFRKCKQETILKTVLTGESGKILIDGKPSIDGLDIYPPDNTDIQEHVIIPDNTLIMSLPTFLQEKMNGVYSAGIGSYLQFYNQKNILFIYPLYNITRYKSDTTHSSKVIFYYIPSYRYGGMDTTYSVDGNLVKIICTSDKKYINDADTQYMNHGVGFLQADARSFMGKPVVMTPNGPKGNPAKITTQVINQSRDDGLNYAPSSKEGISSNLFKQYSEVAKRHIAKITLEWEHSDDSLIYPGMPCEFVYMSDGKRKTITGIIAKSHTFANKSNKGIVTNLYVKKTIVLIYSDRLPKITVAPSMPPAGSALTGRTN